MRQYTKSYTRAREVIKWEHTNLIALLIPEILHRFFLIAALPKQYNQNSLPDFLALKFILQT
jgi:hypothetical protein